MYIVVSHWRPKPGQETEFETLGKKMGEELKSQPGVKFLETFKAGDQYVAVHAYQDEATYKKLVEAPDGPFMNALAATKFESTGEWLSSERGEAL